jgi:hypothetical protein
MVLNINDIVISLLFLFLTVRGFSNTVQEYVVAWYVCM